MDKESTVEFYIFLWIYILKREFNKVTEIFGFAIFGFEFFRHVQFHIYNSTDSHSHNA